MNLRTVAICIYIVSIYWVSSRIPSLHTLFFPTLGAFSLLFIARPFSAAQLGKVAFGAILSSLIGTVLVYLHPGVITLLINTVIVIYLINRFKWNAPPILAVSFVPFFVQSSFIWAIPLSVCGSLLGLLITLFVVHYIERAVPVFLKSGVAKEDTDTAA
ncbi:HPP family protein [Paenibacillus solisilvae]|uniref:HPP family protein n=1 Tax=Paenibacillus solisilvae TaxID=2486751 RepID=A0ABW0W658_9BACL